MKNKVKYFVLVIVTILFLVGCKTEVNDGRRRVYVSPDGDITSDGTSKKVQQTLFLQFLMHYLGI